MRLNSAKGVRPDVTFSSVNEPYKPVIAGMQRQNSAKAIGIKNTSQTRENSRDIKKLARI